MRQLLTLQKVIIPNPSERGETRKYTILKTRCIVKIRS